jgi:hypothetical protein
LKQACISFGKYYLLDNSPEGCDIIGKNASTVRKLLSTSQGKDVQDEEARACQLLPLVGVVVIRGRHFDRRSNDRPLRSRDEGKSIGGGFTLK